MNDTIDITPFLAEALSNVDNIFPDIDKIYKSKKIEYYQAAKNSPYYNSRYTKELPLIREEYFKKVLGILSYGQNESSSEEYSSEQIKIMEDIYSLFKKAYKKIYKLFKNNGEIDMSLVADFIYNNRSIMNDDTLNGNLAAGIYFGLTCDSMKNAEPLLKLMKLRADCTEQGITNFNLDGINKENYEKVKNLIYELPKNILSDITKNNMEEIGDAVASLFFILSSYADTKNKEVKDKSESEKKLIVSLKKKLPKDILNLSFTGLKYNGKDYLNPLDFIYDSEELSYLALFRDTTLTTKDLEEVIYAFIIGQEQFNYKLPLIDYIYPALHIKALLKNYKFVKDMYFSNNKETMYVELESVEKKLDELSLLSTSDHIKYEQMIMEKNKLITKLQDEINSLNNEVKTLNNEIKFNIDYSKEVIALRNYVYQEQMENDESYDITIDIEKIKSYHGIIVGGHPNWQNKMKKIITNWTFISTDMMNFDPLILDNADMILISTGYLNHGMYYKILSRIANTNKTLGYIDSTNINLTLKTIHSLIIK